LKPNSITVFFPCYNEEANVERTTQAALRACQRLFDDYEIIIVNDGSKDRTGEVADRLAREHPRVRAVHNKPNQGYGGALQRGYREASKDWVFYTDGDGQFDFEEMDKLFPLLDKYDIASAYRLNRQDSLMRKVNAFAWTTLVNVLFRLWLRDIDCAFKLLPRRLFDEIEMKSKGALIDTEVLARAKRLGYTIGQVGVHHYPRTAGSQTGANIRVILRAFKELFLLRREIMSTRKKPARSHTDHPAGRANASSRQGKGHEYD
jgi:glycosyltransferase involved in cell wall biosynthesis